MEYLDLDENNKIKISGRYFVLYRVDNLLLGKYYIGITYSSHPITRGYKTSSYNKELRWDYENHKEWFRFSLLKYYDNIDDLIETEKNLLPYSEVINPLCYNLSVGGLFSKLDLTNHRLELDKIRAEEGLLTSMDKSNNTKCLKMKEYDAKGELYGAKLATSNRVINNETRRIKGELTSGDKSGKSKTCNLISREEWLNAEVQLIQYGKPIFSGKCIEALRHLHGDRKYLSERSRFKIYFNNPDKVGKRGVMKGISVINLERSTTSP
jgi:hypothetical protein